MNLERWIFSWVLFVTSVALLKGDEPAAPVIIVPLRRGAFPTYEYLPSVPSKAIILFGSGDGGWGQVENRMCQFLQQNAFYTLGIDFRKYAATDYDPQTLVSDFTVMAAIAAIRAGDAQLPVIYAGWSMGAVQAVAAGGDVEWRSPRLIGLVLMSMDQRGRYGLRLPEQIGIEPQGPNTFGVADFTSAMANLRVTQISAIADWMNNTDWLKTLKTPHRLYQLEHSNHDFNGVDAALQRDLLDGIAWVLNLGQQSSP